MILISHRGNIDGKIPSVENHPSYIDTALNLGYDVEIDVWYVDDKLYLGHDVPQYEVLLEWLELRSPSLWIHCKDMNSLSYFNEYSNKISSQFNYFSHDVDMGVLTSHNYIWSTHLYDRGILVLPELFNREPTERTLGICSDVIKKYKDERK
jgi:hypothetical protein